MAYSKHEGSYRSVQHGIVNQERMLHAEQRVEGHSQQCKTLPGQIKHVKALKEIRVKRLTIAAQELLSDKHVEVGR